MGGEGKYRRPDLALYMEQITVKQTLPQVTFGPTAHNKKKKVEAWALSNDSEPGGFFAESMVYIAQG